jgi:hypothetical protein
MVSLPAAAMGLAGLTGNVPFDLFDRTYELPHALGFTARP